MTTKILFLKSIEEYENAKKAGIVYGQKIICLTYAVQFYLHNNEIQASAIWEYADENEISELLKKGEAIIGQDVCRFFESISAPEISSSIMFSLILFLDEALVSDYYIRRIIEQERPAEINVFSYGTVLCHEKKWNCSIFDEILEYYSEQYEINFNKITAVETQKIEEAKKNNYLLKFLNYFLNTFLYWGISLYANTWLRRSKKKVVLSMVEEGEQKKNFEWLFRYWKNNSEYRVIDYQTSWLKYIDNNIWIALRKRTLKKNAQEKSLILFSKFKSFFNSNTEYASILSNEFLEYHWKKLISSGNEMCALAEYLGKIRHSLFSPYLVVFSAAHHISTLAYRDVFKKINLKMLILPHSLLPFSYKELYTKYDYVLANGNYQEEILNRKLGVGIERLFKLNDERFLTIDRSQLSKQSEDGKTIITIVTSDIQSACGYFPKWEFKVSQKKTYDYLMSAAALGNLGENFQIIFKSHPFYDYYSLYDQFSNKNIKHISRKPIKEILKLSDLIIIIAPHSDVIFEAALLGKKLIYCSSGMENEFDRRLSELLPVIDDPDQLLPLVHELVEEKCSKRDVQKIIDNFLTVKEQDSFNGI